MSLVRSNIGAMHGYTPGEQPGDVSVIKLNTNENPYPPSPKAIEAIRQVMPEQLRRYPNPDARAFRLAAAKVHGVSSDMIIATNGGDELLSIVVRACVGENDTIAWLEPGYSLYPVLAAMQAARPLPVQYEVQGNEWKLPKGLAGINARLLLIVNPNAPSGTLTPVEQLSELAAGFGGLLLVDEAYVDFAPQSALPLLQRHSNVILLRSMSKGYGLAGLRFGYGIAQPGLIAELNKVRDSYPCDAVAIAAATAAIQDQPYAQSTWQRVIAEREALTQKLRAKGFSIPSSHSNFILATVPAGRDAAVLYQQLKDRNILVRYFALPGLLDKLRITIGTPEQNNALATAITFLLS